MDKASKDQPLSHLDKEALELEPAQDDLKRVQSHLERKNEELKRTIAELREAKETITSLQEAENRTKSVILKQTERIARVSLLDFISILLASTVVGLLFNASDPSGVALLPESLFRPTPPLVSATETKELLDRDEAVLVDARPVEFFREGHIKDALNVPPSLFDVIYTMKLSGLDSQKTIIVYGRNISRHYDEEVAQRLMQRDRENVKVFTGGLSAWSREGYPVEQ